MTYQIMILFLIGWIGYLVFNSVKYLYKFFRSIPQAVQEIINILNSYIKVYDVEINGEIVSFENFESAAEVLSYETGEQS